MPLCLWLDILQYFTVTGKSDEKKNLLKYNYCPGKQKSKIAFK